LLLNFQYLSTLKPEISKLKLSFFFVSLITPNFNSVNVDLQNSNKNFKKIYLKQSYILFTWFYYMTLANKRKKNIKVFVLPIQKKISTQIKAPIAHKNWSKEQFLFRYYLLRISFFGDFRLKNIPNSSDAGLLCVLLSKKNFPVFETNILFLKNYKIMFFFNDFLYFNYFRLISKK
jgi:hypothetical protein